MAVSIGVRLMMLLTGDGAAKAVAPAAVGGVGSAYSIPQLNAAGTIDITHLPPGVNPEVTTATASEAIAAGSYVQVLPQNAAEPTVRNADASANKPATHFVLAAVANGAQATCYRVGQNSAVAGVVPGDVYLSDTTPGGVTAVPPTTTGHLVQKVGQALSAANIDTKISDAILLA